MIKHPLRTLLCALALLSGHVHADTLHTAPQVPAQVSNAAWENDMQRFADSDAQQQPPKHGIVFVGSSSIRFWDTLAQDFPGKPVINRGFGGSEVRDSTWYADRIVIPYMPRQVVLYAGDNDLNSGRTPEQVRDDVLAFVTRIRSDLPKARISYLSIKPSPSRAHLLPAIVTANRLIKDALAPLPRVDYVDVYTPMLDASGKPRAELFREDMLHMTADGYAIWRKAVAPVLEQK
ncbi:SGNH/GDSL hydrolase family protein [Xanthomonas hortorum]|uniref:SGNH hydrolase-type esterase domain-containing protein n=1 Tax=Xanthomonas hortorum pv. pelargonii TaxID=453602 RepID=A0A6V7EFV0_9XANT|nr:SGNH/GDSL hydrolase family protein [Xanthomonas hortorum]MCE4352914.1 GDSL-type esterase/lipase family protein [Xanthomonas hortorum pv. pelargonii]MCM5523418.1 SGNH/GDSL hydrolase family protein [Xanthomonas hortorum pv. pelargonii]MCM5536054.1 SGNH/GDSL hydrolase family protein [Xanthomonas hortorum pv. pelargonii]MCM5540035.1 SGNH/GDSL hydrolase family protein [Xanthomonas hortorum pv. pelargonii]MCM5543262.1 SGNH/GDSL hydrolase family protein [Xanthomonas hortorum pv. pelargonii]